MKLLLSLILFIALVPAFNVAANETSNAGPSVDTLRLQLLEVETKEAELLARAKQLDEDLKPENIERSLAGVGSTKPEELRELRLRQLSIEREGVRAQLKILATSRERLDSVIRTAEAKAYQESAEGSSSPLDQALLAQSAGSNAWRVGMLAGVIALLGIVLVFAKVYRTRTNQ